METILEIKRESPSILEINPLEFSCISHNETTFEIFSCCMRQS